MGRYLNVRGKNVSNQYTVVVTDVFTLHTVRLSDRVPERDIWFHGEDFFRYLGHKY
jgi:hypothetical protein